MKRGVLLLAVAVLLAGCAQSFAGAPNSGSDGATENPATELSTTAPTTSDVERNVSATFVVDGQPAANATLEVADEPEERRIGLMHRRSLPERHGMVFAYPDEAPLTFWMKNTYVPLDMIFVAANGTVVDVDHAAPQPNATDSELRRYRSDAPAKYVIELQRGFANRTGVERGTNVRFDGTVAAKE